MENNDLALLERCYDMTHAHILRGLLETNNIPCFLMDEHHSAVAWHIGLAVGGLRVMVLKSDLEMARTIITENLSTGDGTERKQLLRRPYFRNIVLGIFGLFSGAPLVWPDKGNK